MKFQTATIFICMVFALKSTSHVNCSIAASLAVIGERWSLLIVREAIMGSTRFDEFHDRIGVARNILNVRLQTLVEHGILSRHASPYNARIFLYTLTKKGLELWPVLVAVMQWGDRWLHAEIGAPVILLDRKSRKPLSQIVLAANNGNPINYADIAITAGPGATPLMRKRFVAN
jgi:DNA-binding HxlR family transcriptional regulator